MGYEFTLVDVFTDRQFGGNQLAVFPDAQGIDDRTMQNLAREFNFSESAFVLPPVDPANTCRVRIFTPNEELPFAGHPTIGTAAVLARDRDLRQFVFEEGIGPVTVTLDEGLIRLHLASPTYLAPDLSPESGVDPPSTDAIAKTLGVDPDAIVDSWFAGVGLRFCLVRLRDKNVVDQAGVDRASWQAGFANAWAGNLYVFAGSDPLDAVYARMFGPGVGVEEDPATGSACASLIASLAVRSPSSDGTFEVRVEQGVTMGRPSELEGRATMQNGQVTEVVVGGQAVIVGDGTMAAPN